MVQIGAFNHCGSVFTSVNSCHLSCLRCVKQELLLWAQLALLLVISAEQRFLLLLNSWRFGRRADAAFKVPVSGFLSTSPALEMASEELMQA